LAEKGKMKEDPRRAMISRRKSCQPSRRLESLRSKPRENSARRNNTDSEVII